MYNALQHDENHIGMTCSLMYRQSILNKETVNKILLLPVFFLFNFVEIFFYCVEFFVKLPVSFKDS